MKSPKKSAHDAERIKTEGRDTIERALKDFMLYNHAARLAPTTDRFYRCQLTPFARWCHQYEIQSERAISPTVIRGYLASLLDRGLSDYSVHAAARAIRAFLNFCVCEGRISVSPMSKVARPRIDRRILPAFTHDDVHKLLRVCTEVRDEAIILFLLDTGCRAAEMVGLDGGDINLLNGEINIRKDKGRKDRIVFLGQSARAGLLGYYAERCTPGEHEPVWISQTREERLTPSGLHQLLKRLGERAGIENCAPHTFRRTFAIWCLRNGMDVFRLARLMGHADISVLRQYLYLLKDDLRAAHAQFGTVGRLLGAWT